MNDSNKIAIVGYAGSLTGCPDAEQLWQLTSQGKEGIRRYTQEEIAKHLPASFYQLPSFRPVGGGPENYRQFDAAFFGYNPKEAAYMDPQIRKSLEYAWLACEHAGYAPDQISAPTGVYTVSAVNSYFNENLAVQYHQRADLHEQTQLLYLNEPDFMASRIAYHFNWQGPAVNLRSGCSSSLVAIHEACMSLLQFDIDMAVVGGAVIKPRYQYGYHHEQDGIQSDSGHCAPFSADADGTIFTNGVGFLVLKRYEDAIKDGDSIHAVVLATAINNDGCDKVGYMAPSVSGQIRVMLGALANAELEPQDITYIEAHGTGTSVGDPIEFEALTKVFDGLPAGSVALSTVKANIGHLDALSGIAAVLKVIQDMKHQSVSPLANYTQPHPAVRLDQSPFTIPQSLTEWQPSASYQRIAAISSFGVGGTNGALILEQAPADVRPTVVAGTPVFIGFSARTPDVVFQQVKRMHDWLKEHPESQLADIAWTLLSGRSAFKYRWGCVVDSVSDLCDRLSMADSVECMTVTASRSWTLEEAQQATAVQLSDFWLSDGNIVTNTSFPKSCRRIPLPGYPFQAHDHWIDAEPFNTEQGQSTENRKISDISQWFYTPYWKKQRISALTVNITGKRILMFHHDDSFSGQFSEELIQQGASLLHVVAGEKYARLGDDHYRIEPGNEMHMKLLIQDLAETAMLPDWVVHLWCLGNQNETTDRIQSQGLYTMVAWCKAYNELALTVNFHTLLVADRMISIVGEEDIEPAKSTLLGISQVLPKEYQDIQCHLVDIAPNFQAEQTIRMLLAEMGSGSSSEIAIRGVHRFVKDYARYSVSETQLGESLLSGNKTILIVGGLGNFGLELAEFVALNYQAQVYLTTRTRFPAHSEWQSWLEQHGSENIVSEKILHLQRIENLGGRVEILTADITCRQDLVQIKTLLQTRHRRVDGVIHAAGTVDSGMIHTKTRDSLEQVFSPKIAGTMNLCDVFLPLNPDFILLCSSMNAIIGGLGQVDNTAANAFVDAWAEHCHQRGYTQVLAINWGAVNEARARNYSAQPQFKELSREHIKNKMSQDEIFEVYRRLFSTTFGSRVVVSTLDFNKVIENWSRVGSVASLTQKVTLISRSRDEFVQTSWKDPLSTYEITVAKHWEALLGIERVGNDDNFFELGGNSLIVLQLISLLKKDYPIRMHAMAIYEHPTVREFAAHVEQLAREYMDKVQIA
ncbi:SDR family NAD(P)-dependent oxidoreductase [Pantoea ananatis]|jgi:polyketide synthase PksJ|uniref:SDR family NAD(P)-dependent oxidoreductase n=1 Tax=Pantoea ananas TaxID=553 RepID=UPI0002EEA76D|nr:SDR family NAD(P)-dependent oxidoreductase [Pantoea ananatis]MDQ1224007.1 3-oxoacyl-(acyl-carrier-protein) synthase/NAD(P)-dependent dehydrogenase (short-subunit alcohol dehydrogenase family)/acyl carrier protein [Pantoea ananatis]MDR6091953.1 3-oxoacyl-(acyl-carrier-protein) synthase/NAD(P)-dependent dehydrogenase (short-subunit alcohol dehydrogenase family)/acyl carrier protein [Pantoea ananatis]PWV63558.1 ketoacyl-synthetase-like protein [Pantoea ananatis]HCN03951.1 KR domain-containing p